MSFYTSDFSGPRYGGLSFLDYVDLRDRADVLSGLIAYWRTVSEIKERCASGSSHYSGHSQKQLLEGNYFDVLSGFLTAARAYD